MEILLAFADMCLVIILTIILFNQWNNGENDN